MVIARRAVLKMKTADKHFRSSCLKHRLRSFLHWLVEWKVLPDYSLNAETFGRPVFRSAPDIVLALRMAQKSLEGRLPPPCYRVLSFARLGRGWQPVNV